MLLWGKDDIGITLKILNSQALGWDSWVSSALKSILLGGPYYWISCKIFHYYPEIHFYTHFWNQYLRKNSLTPKKFHCRRPIFIKQHIFIQSESQRFSSIAGWMVRSLGWCAKTREFDHPTVWELTAIPPVPQKFMDSI